MLQKYMRNDQMWRGWYWCPTDVADLRMERVLYLSRRWKAEGKPIIPTDLDPMVEENKKVLDD